jgi:8-oxo-dGTP diphosphatase
MQKVTAAIIIRNNMYLIAKRKTGGSLSGKWEFPGGKVEPGETPEQGLVREIDEEFGVAVKVGKFVGSHKFNNEEKEYELLAYYCEILSGEITLNVHEDMKWISIREFDDFDFAESDKEILRILKLMKKNEN